MRIHQVPEQPFTYIVENDHGRHLGTVDEFHASNTATGTITIHYIARRLASRGMIPDVEVEEFRGFTAALQYVGGD